MSKFSTADDFMAPHDIRAETSTLGACILSGKAAEQVRGVLRPEMFYVPAHQLVSASVFELSSRGVGIDFTTLSASLGDSLKTVGGVDYLIQVAESVPSAANAEYYAEIVHQKWVERSMEQRCHSIIKAIYDDPKDAIRQATEILSGLLLDGTREAPWEQSVAKGREGLKPGIPFFLPRLNETSKVNGLPRGEFHILGAFTGFGKSTGMCQEIIHACRQGYRGAVVTLEMSASELAWKMLQQVTGYVSLDHAEACGDGDKYREAVEEVGAFDLSVLDASADFEQGLTLNRALQWLTEKHVYTPLDYAFIDYVQILEPEPREQRGPDFQHRISRKCKAWAKRRGVCMIGLAQIQPDKSDEKGWRFRYGGKYEEDACFIVTKQVVKTDVGKQDVYVIDKARFGKRGRIDVSFDTRREVSIQL